MPEKGSSIGTDKAPLGTDIIVSHALVEMYQASFSLRCMSSSLISIGYDGIKANLNILHPP